MEVKKKKMNIKKYLSLVVLVVVIAAIGAMMMADYNPSQKKLNEVVEKPLIEELRPGEGFICDGKQVRINNIVVSKKWFRDNYQMNAEKLFQYRGTANFTTPFRFFGSDYIACFQVVLNETETTTPQVILGHYDVDKKEGLIRVETLFLGESCEIGKCTIKLKNVELEMLESESGMRYPVCPKAIIELT